jgi:chromate transport protein ChrA
VALVGSILPTTLLMFAVASALRWLSGEAWVGGFVRGLAPAVAVLMVLVAWKVFQGEATASINWVSIAIAGGSLIAYLLNVPAPLVLVAAGFVGILFLR